MAENVRTALRMQDHGVRLHCVNRIGKHRQILIIDHDLFYRFGSNFFSLGDHQRYLVTDKAHALSIGYA